MWNVRCAERGEYSQTTGMKAQCCQSGHCLPPSTSAVSSLGAQYLNQMVVPVVESLSLLVLPVVALVNARHPGA